MPEPTAPDSPAGPRSTRRSRLKLAALLAILLAVGLSIFARAREHRRVDLATVPGWVTTDPDSLYHARRLLRFWSEDGPVAERDAYLDFPRRLPEGAPIPWPPYYTYVLALALGPFAPDVSPGSEAADLERLRRFVEQGAASLPLLFGVLATLVAALAGLRLAGTPGALAAGLLHALCAASVAYSKSGNGDHHAFVALLAGLLLLGTSLALGGGVLDRPRRSALAGLGLGALAGLALGSWVGSVLIVLQLQLVLGWLVLRQARHPRAGLPWLGASFHVGALLVLLPAVLASPWKAEYPWMVVNLSWFHPAWLGLGALVFAPLLFVRAGPLVRRWPWIVAGALALLGALLAFGSSAPARGLRAGFEWVSRTDEFMATVGESRPLIGAGSGSGLFEALGYGVLLAPFAWAALAREAFARGRLELLPWAVALPLLALQAARQARFADALAVPLAVVLAAGLGLFLKSSRGSFLRAVPRPLGALFLFLVVLLLQAPLTTKLPRHHDAPRERERPARLAVRGMSEWVRRQPSHDPARGVLALWGWGHTIEWAADLPSVSTNFGSYVGRDSLLDPPRFFMEEDPARAYELLEQRRVRYVFLSSDLPGALNFLIDGGAPDRRERYVRPGGGGAGGILPAWLRTMGARLMFDGAVLAPGDPEGREAPLDRLRLVWVSPLLDPGRPLPSGRALSPAGWAWEFVAGAVIEARGEPGAVLELSIPVRLPKASHQLTWAVRVAADETGLVRARVPYATLEPNGSGWVTADQARWKMGRESGSLLIPERAVLGGQTVPLR